MKKAWALSLSAVLMLSGLPVSAAAAEAGSVADDVLNGAPGDGSDGSDEITDGTGSGEESGEGTGGEGTTEGEGGAGTGGGEGSGEGEGGAGTGEGEESGEGNGGMGNIGEESEENLDEVVEEEGLEKETVDLNTLLADGRIESLTELDAIATAAGDLASVTMSIENKQIMVDGGGLVLLSNTEVNLEGFTVYLSSISGGVADLTRDVTVNYNGSGRTFSFTGLGSDTIPFAGRFVTQDATYSVETKAPFFANIDLSKVQVANLTTLKIKRKNDTTAMLAGKMSGIADAGWQNVEVVLEKASTTSGGTTIENLPGTLIDTMGEGTSFSLRKVTYNHNASVYAQNGHVGLLCNTMKAGSTLTVPQLAVAGSVELNAATGYAGGLVGLMENGAHLAVANNGTAITIGDTYHVYGQVAAGGLVGYGEAVDLSGTAAVINGADVRSQQAAGGLMGRYTTGQGAAFSAYDGSAGSLLRVDQVALNAGTNNAYCGGVFGVLSLTSDFVMADTAARSTLTGSTARYGGLVGQVKGDSADSLKGLYVQGNTTPNMTISASLNCGGGLAGFVGEGSSTPAYVHVAGTFEPTVSGMDKSTRFGGFVGYFKVKSVIEMADDAIVKPHGCTQIPAGGGLVGTAEAGTTLALAGTTDLSETSLKSTNTSCGQIIGTMDTGLAYARSSWTLIRQTTPQAVDDIANYGEIIRLGGNVGKGTPADATGLSADLITQDPITHKTVFKSDALPTVSDGTITLNSADQFALLSIEEQTKRYFGILSAGNDYYLKGNQAIVLGADISLAHTGVMGLQRDIDEGYNFEGSLDGGNHTLTLDTGEIYGYRGTAGTDALIGTVGSGQIHGHNRVGVFSRSNGAMKDLDIAGTMNLYFRNEMLAGGLVAQDMKAGTFDNVDTALVIDCRGTAGGSVGGILGQKDAEASTTALYTNCIGDASISVIGNGAVYVGGLIGSFNGAAPLEISTCVLMGDITVSNVANAQVGGLIGRISAVNGSNYVAVNVTLKDIVVDDQTITVNNASTSAGGLLGYEWNNAHIIIGDKTTHSRGITVMDGSAVTVTGAAESAGLVYAATGYWQLNDIRLNKMAVSNGSGPLGLLIFRGWRQASTWANPYYLYLEETGYNAYRINSADVTVSSGGGAFDEWVVYTCLEASSIQDNGNAIISIATAPGSLVEGERVGIDPTESTSSGYQNRTAYGKGAAPNPNARYYYDLDLIREKATANNVVDTPGELVLWAAWRYCEKAGSASSNIQKYFIEAGKSSDATKGIIGGNNAEIDLTGYSYYPISVNSSNFQVKYVTIIFANKAIEEAEKLTGGDLDNLQRVTVGTPTDHTQHYLMHAGLILYYRNIGTSADTTLAVTNLTLKGSVGQGPEGGSGALICGALGGNTSATAPKYAKLDINGLKMDGLTVNAPTGTGDYAPLLVNKLDSYTSLSAQKVTVTGYDGYSPSHAAGTSLIGHVGHDAATNISLAFANGIALSGRPDDSIFSHATLLESFQYVSGGSGYYHFNQGEDCTYGREITESIENAGLQLHYYDEQEVEVEDNGNKNFSRYLPYVCQPYADGGIFHELEVNIQSPDLMEGCGTYDDPYIITSARQLQFAARFVNDGSAQPGWKVNKVTDPSAVVSAANPDAHHTLYEADVNWNNSVMRTYLQNAYYQIRSELPLSLNDFAGFGSGDYPFKGVIDGKKADGSTCTVIIKTSANESGLINTSTGAVVQNLTIQYDGSKTFTGLQKPAANARLVTEKAYFGGVIGTVRGGDSIIDNVRVVFPEGFTVTTTDTLQCVGGFVGLIQGGGVVFRRMGSAADNPGYTGDKTSHYMDTYIGRVLDGYALNEAGPADGSAQVTFAGSNYSIPDLAADAAIDWNGGNISLGNAQAMIILSAIINSGSANGGQSLAYKAGSVKTRNASYAKIGAVTDASDADFLASRLDDTAIGTGNLPFMIARHGGNAAAAWEACKTGALTLTFGQGAMIDLSPYGNGYRAIGTRYSCLANQITVNSATSGKVIHNTPEIAAVNGQNASIKTNVDFREYSDDSFRAAAVGGLFNVLRHKGATVENLNVYGNVHLASDMAFTINEEKMQERAPVGGLAGRDFTTATTANYFRLTLNNVTAGNPDERSTFHGECVTGGFIGSVGARYFTVFTTADSNRSVITFKNCAYENIEIVGGHNAGGLAGAVVRNSPYISKFDSNVVNNITANEAEKTIVEVDAVLNTGADSLIRNQEDLSSTIANGVGGLFGFLSNSAVIKGTETTPVKLYRITSQGGGTNSRARTAGCIGLTYGNSNGNFRFDMQHLVFSEGQVGRAGDYYRYDDNAGALFGAWYAKGTMNVQDIRVEKSSFRARACGGVLGWSWASACQIYLKNIELIENTITQRDATAVGGIGGNINGELFGQNILMQNTTFSSVTNSGRFFGAGAKTRLLGVCVQQENGKALPANDVRGTGYGSYGSSVYMVYGGYKSYGEINTAAEVATLPTRTIENAGALHGDTLNPQTVVDIVANSGTVKDYQNLSGAKVTSEKINESIISSYNEQQETQLSAGADFPVVLIDGDASVLKQYLDAATNGGFENARQFSSYSKHSVTFTRYQRVAGTDTFTPVTNKTLYPDTLVYNKTTGQFTTTAAFDNQQDTFTLVTVTFTGLRNEPYTLHIPVVVRRMLQVDFMATMSTGTIFNKPDSAYAQTRDHALASQGEEITGYLTFLYNSNQSDLTDTAAYDWQGYMEAGGDLIGYYKKTVDTGAQTLPVGTKITLLDSQRGDRRYYATVTNNGGTHLELWNGGKLNFTATDGTAFEPVSLSELLNITAAPATDAEKADASAVTWIQLPSATGATVKAADGHYYRIYKSSDGSSVARYTLTINNAYPKESYFVVITVPHAESHRMTMDKTGMVWSEKTSSPPLEVHQVHRYNPQLLDPKDANSEASFNYLDNYRQTLVDNTDAINVAVDVAGATATMPISVTDTITFNRQNYTEQDPLYQNLIISLKKTENRVQTGVAVPSDAVAVDDDGVRDNAVKLYAYIKDGSGNPRYYVWNGTKLVAAGSDRTPAVTYAWSGSEDSSEMLLPFAEKTADGYRYIDLSVLRNASVNTFYLEAETNLQLSVASILTNNTIPYDSAVSAIENFTQVDAKAVVSFTEGGLAHSTLKGSTADRDTVRKYYLNTARAAFLKLDYTNMDQLGINGLEKGEGVIDTLLTLDLSALEGFDTDVTKFRMLAEADTLVFNLSLRQRNNTDYVAVAIGDYMAGASISQAGAMSNYTITLTKAADGSYPYYQAQAGQFVIPVTFTVDKTVTQYANYRIYADATLYAGGVDQEMNVDGTDAFITYTYAKINTNGYWN
ncbi:MAG: hypothetical protein Q4B73_06820 [Lachnospiraceae bacterium]|nr:hypothetical protein [Lachnospiraceae bacterium]